MSAHPEEQRYVIVHSFGSKFYNVRWSGRPVQSYRTLEGAIDKVCSMKPLHVNAYVWLGSNPPHPVCACIGLRRAWASKPIYHGPWAKALEIYASHLRMLQCQYQS